jgi:hypothetical protein
MNDPLAKYRTKAANAPVSFAAPDGPDEYAAFSTKDRVERLKIKCANQPTRAPGYENLLEIVYDGRIGTNFVLSFSWLMVLVRGKNLQPVIMALLAGTADYIQEFDPEIWERPSDAKKPIIESIEVVVHEKQMEMAKVERPSL